MYLKGMGTSFDGIEILDPYVTYHPSTPSNGIPPIIQVMNESSLNVGALGNNLWHRDPMKPTQAFHFQPFYSSSFYVWQFFANKKKVILHSALMNATSLWPWVT